LSTQPKPQIPPPRLPTEAELAALTTLAAECLNLVAAIAASRPGPDGGVDRQSSANVLETRQRLAHLLKSAARDEHVLTLRWVSAAQMRTILIAGKYWCRSYHHAAIRLGRLTCQCWPQADETGVDARVVKFYSLLRTHRLLVSKRKLRLWMAKVLVEASRCVELIGTKPTGRPTATPIESDIVDALKKHGKPIAGEALLRIAKLPYNGSHKGALASLVHRGVLRNTRPLGYYLPEWDSENKSD
jgi:hypothetical protein